MSIYKKLAELKKEVGKISKKETNPFFKSKYFDINGLIEHLEPLLEKHNLLLLQPIESNKVSSVLVDYESGEQIQSSLELPHYDDPQKMGSCITYYRRYTLQSLLGLQAEDDDANSAKQGGKSKKQWLNKGTEQWDKAIAYIQKGGSIADIQKKYAISKDNLTELQAI